jgi:hypothetical protein
MFGSIAWELKLRAGCACGDQRSRFEERPGACGHKTNVEFILPVLHHVPDPNVECSTQSFGLQFIKSLLCLWLQEIPILAGLPDLASAVSA